MVTRYLLAAVSGALLLAAPVLAQGKGKGRPGPARPAGISRPAAPAPRPVARPMPSAPRPVAAPAPRPVVSPPAPGPVVGRPTPGPTVVRPTPGGSPAVVTQPGRPIGGPTPGGSSPAVTQPGSRPTVVGGTPAVGPSPKVNPPTPGGSPATANRPTPGRPTASVGTQPAKTGATAVRPKASAASSRSAFSPVTVSSDGQTVTLPNGTTVPKDVFLAFAASQRDPNGWFWQSMGGYPFNNYAPWYGPYWAIGLGFGSPFGYGYPFGYGFGSGLSFAYGSGNWAIGATFGWPAFGYQSASMYAPVYAPAYDSGYSSPSTVIVAPPATVIPPATETVPPPAVESAPPATEVDFLTQGMELFHAGKYPEAARALRHAVVDEPQNGNILALTGEALFAAGSLDEAAGALQRSLAITPEEYWASTTAQMTRLAPAEATESLRKAVEKDPGVPSLRFLAAYQAFGQGEYQQAQTHLDALLKKAPDDAVAKKLHAQAKKHATGKE
jgi:tetratricopeptide (TPR) repeat protein